MITQSLVDFEQVTEGIGVSVVAYNGDACLTNVASGLTSYFGEIKKASNTGTSTLIPMYLPNTLIESTGSTTYTFSYASFPFEEESMLKGVIKFVHNLRVVTITIVTSGVYTFYNASEGVVTSGTGAIFLIHNNIVYRIG